MLRVFNESIGKFVSKDNSLTYGIINYNTENKIIEFGYFSKNDPTITIFTNIGYFPALLKNIHTKLYFDRSTGRYKLENPNNDYLYVTRPEHFPYTHKNYYSTRYLENIFEKSTELSKDITFNFIDEMPFTFGLEFETAGGLIPEDLVYKLGLIPLRDGSIRGIEYSTIILKGQEGFNLLKKQLEALEEYTIFDKECALHIHFGGFKLNPDTLLRVNNIMAYLSDIDNYVPQYTFKTSLYKANRKNYNSKNKAYSSFDSLYKHMVGRDYENNLYLSHPDDPTGNRKWNCHQRYVSCNLINAICYNFNKTIEFRFLRPTYNFDKIICWIFLLAAIIKYAEDHNKIVRNYMSLCSDIIYSVYSLELANILLQFLNLQKYVCELQNSMYDYIGMRTDVENKVIKKKHITKNNQLKYFY